MYLSLTRLFLLFTFTTLFNLSLQSKPKVLSTTAKVNELQGNLKITNHHYRRREQQVHEWRPLKIYFDLTKLVQKNPSRANFYQKVFEATGKWYSEALYVRDNKSKIAPEIRRMIKHRVEDKFSTDKIEDYDLLVHVQMVKNEETTLAWAGPLIRHPDSQRPISGQVGITWFGNSNFKHSSNAVTFAVGTIIHEFAHIIAFIEFEVYHARYTKYDRSTKLYYFNGPNVVKSMAKYYDCPLEQASKGMPLETFGTDEPGAHWDEAATKDELMSPIGGEEPEKVSPMTMAQFEDSGWYLSNYRFVENYSYKKGSGCGFIQKGNSVCPKEPVCKKGTDGFLTSDYMGLGYCENSANGCFIEIKYSNRNCQTSEGWERYLKKYGPTYGGTCTIAQGEIYYIKPNAKSSEYTAELSVATECAPNNKSYTLTFKKFKWDLKKHKYSGDLKITCDKKGTVSFNEYGELTSSIECHDPESLCTKRFSANQNSLGEGCHKSCIQNGRCHPGFVTEARKLEELLRNFNTNLKLKKLQNDLHNARMMTLELTDELGKLSNNSQTNFQKNSSSIITSTRKLTQKTNRNNLKLNEILENRYFNDWGSDNEWTLLKQIGNTRLLEADNSNIQENFEKKKLGLQNSYVFSERFLDSKNDSHWKCWCYSDGNEHDQCPDLIEDELAET